MIPAMIKVLVIGQPVVVMHIWDDCCCSSECYRGHRRVFEDVSPLVATTNDGVATQGGDVEAALLLGVLVRYLRTNIIGAWWIMHNWLVRPS